MPCTSERHSSLSTSFSRRTSAFWSWDLCLSISSRTCRSSARAPRIAPAETPTRRALPRRAPLPISHVRRPRPRRRRPVEALAPPSFRAPRDRLPSFSPRRSSSSRRTSPTRSLSFPLRSSSSSTTTPRPRRRLSRLPPRSNLRGCSPGTCRTRSTPRRRSRRRRRRRRSPRPRFLRHDRTRPNPPCGRRRRILSPPPPRPPPRAGIFPRPSPSTRAPSTTASKRTTAMPRRPRRSSRRRRRRPSFRIHSL
mmetsp:Transcript_8251/g.17825  ORF Transcript_8251/g.17825 Transcript_8251/m.17825 type:complete len:251 (-) Transcript_8251:120-872(-)